MKTVLKRLLVPLIVGILLIFSASTFANKPATISFMYYGFADEMTVLEEMVEGFTRRNPDIKVKFIPAPAASWGEYFDKLAKEGAAGHILELTIG